MYFPSVLSLSSFSLDITSAVIRSSVLGIDLRTAYANRKYLSGRICPGVTSGLAAVKLSGSPRIYVCLVLVLILL